jgi:hypothetical protein
MVEREVLFFYFVFNLFLFLPTLIPLSGVGTTCFSLYCNKDSAIIFMTSACLTSTLLENGVGTVVVVVVVVRLVRLCSTTANAAGTNGFTYLPKHRVVVIVNLFIYIYLVPDPLDRLICGFGVRAAGADHQRRAMCQKELPALLPDGWKYIPFVSINGSENQ